MPVSKLTEILLVEKLHEYTGVILPFVTDFNTITDVIDFGNEEQQERIMDVINNVESTCVACSAISEPAAGSEQRRHDVRHEEAARRHVPAERPEDVGHAGRPVCLHHGCGEA